jgi:hypothetical protein
MMAVIPTSSSVYIHPAQLAKALGGEARGDTVRGPGPGHSPRDRSLSIKVDPAAPGGMVVYSFAGDDPLDCKDYVRSKAGLPDWKPAQKNNSTQKPVATYPYRDRDGTLLYEVLRYDPKDFRQRHRGPNGDWVWKQANRSVPYRWPDLIQFPDATVFLCEGEKDADRLAQCHP